MDADNGVDSGITKIKQKESALMLSSTAELGKLVVVKGKTAEIEPFLLDIRSITSYIMGSSVAFLDSIESIEQCKGSNVKDVIDQHRSNNTPFNNLVSAMRQGVFVQRYVMYNASEYATKVKPYFNVGIDPVELKVVDEEGVIEEYPTDTIENEVECLMAISRGESVECPRPYLKQSSLIGSDNELQLYNERKEMFENLLEGGKVVHNRCDDDSLHFKALAQIEVVGSLSLEVREANPSAKLCSILPGYLFYTNRDPHVHAALFMQYCKESASLSRDLLANKNIHTLVDVKDNAYLDNVRVSNAIFNAVGKIGASASDRNGFVCWSFNAVRDVKNPFEVECYSIAQLKNIELGKRQDLVLNSVVASNAVDALCVSLQFGVKENGEKKEDKLLQFELPSIQACAVWVVGVQDQVSLVKKAKTILKGMKNERAVLASSDSYIPCDDNVLIVNKQFSPSNRTDVVFPSNVYLDSNNLIYVNSLFDAETALPKPLNAEEKGLFPYVRIGTLHSEALPFKSPNGLTLFPVSVDSPPFAELLNRNHVTLASDGYVYSLYTYERYAIDVSGNVYNTDYPADNIMQVHVSDISTLPICGITRTCNIFLDSDLAFTLFGDLDPAPGLRALTRIIANRPENDLSTMCPKYTTDDNQEQVECLTNTIDLATIDASYYEVIRAALLAYCGLPLNQIEQEHDEEPVVEEEVPLPPPEPVESEPVAEEKQPVVEEQPVAEEQPAAEPEPVEDPVETSKPTVENKRRVVVKRVRKLIKGKHGEDLVEETIEEIFASDLEDDDHVKLYKHDQNVDSDEEEKDDFDPEAKERTLLKLRRGRVPTKLQLKDVETVDYSGPIEEDESDDHVNAIRDRHMAIIQAEKEKLMEIKRAHETQLLEAQLAQKARIEQEKTMLEEARLAHVARIRAEEAKLLEEARLQAVRLEYQALMRAEENKLAKTREDVRKMIQETADVYKVKTTEQVTEEKKMVEFKKQIEREQLEERLKREAEIAADLEELRLLRLEKEVAAEKAREEHSRKQEEERKRIAEDAEKQRAQDDADRINRAIEEKLIREGKMLVDIDGGNGDADYDEFEEGDYDAYTGQYYGADNPYSYDNKNNTTVSNHGRKNSSSLPPPPPPFSKSNQGAVDYQTYYGNDVYTDEGYYDENGQYRTYGDRKSDFTMPEGVTNAITSAAGAINNTFNTHLDAASINNSLTSGIQSAHTGGLNLAFMAQMMAMNGMNQAQIMAMTGMNQSQVLAATAQSNMKDFASQMQNQFGAFAGQANEMLGSAQNQFGAFMNNAGQQANEALAQGQQQAQAAFGQAQAAFGQAQGQALSLFNQGQQQGQAALAQGQQQGQAALAQAQQQGQAALAQGQQQAQVAAEQAQVEAQKLASLAQSQSQSLALVAAAKGDDIKAAQGQAMGEANKLFAASNAKAGAALGGLGGGFGGSSSLGVGVTSTNNAYEDEEDEEYYDEEDEGARYAASPKNAQSGKSAHNNEEKPPARKPVHRRAVRNDEDDAYDKDEGEVDPVRRTKIGQSRGMCSTKPAKQQQQQDDGGCVIM